MLLPTDVIRSWNDWYSSASFIFLIVSLTSTGWPLKMLLSIFANLFSSYSAIIVVKSGFLDRSNAISASLSIGRAPLREPAAALL